MTTTASLENDEPTPVKKTRRPRKKPTVSKKLPSNPFMNEILELVDEQKSDAKKVAIISAAVKQHINENK